MKSLKFNIFLGAAFCYLIIIVSLLLHHNFINKIQSQEPLITKYEESIPSSLSIPNIQLTIPIENGQYDQESDSWNISDNFAYYAQESMPLNSDLGNSVIYAHNKPHLFGSLRNLSPGDVAQVTDVNGIVHEYIYQKSVELSPKDTNVFYSEDSYHLILLTCSGLFDRYRTLHYFLPI